MQTCIFGEDIAILQDTLHIFRSYYIKNAYVKAIQPQYRIVNNEYQWIINTKTLVKEAEQVEETTPILHHLVSLKDLPNYIDFMAEVGKIIYILN